MDSDFCSIEECSKKKKRRGWCQAHYTRWLRHGDPLGGSPTHRDESGLAQDGKKRCRACNEVKDVSEFSIFTKAKDGYAYKCRPCQAEIKRQRRKDNPEAVRAMGNRYYHDNKLSIAAGTLLRTYGITQKEREAMNEAQGGLCASCGHPPTGKGHTSKLFLDHCHATGKIRGLLCHPCNVALGLLRDDPVRIRALLTFVERG